jgi:ankyrin repeat protein
MLQCLMVAVRPLRVEELAELLAFEFTAQVAIPKYHADWRPNDHVKAVLSICSSLVSIVDDSSSQVVQFSHFSVKEFLMSRRLGDFSHYQILPRPAHTILSQACLGCLLHLDGHVDERIVEGPSLAEYAAKHWVTHAQLEDVASHVKDGMETLFDCYKPHFAAWLRIYNMDGEFSPQSPSKIPTPIYYSSLCGFSDLVEHLSTQHPQHVNAIGGKYKFPLLAALVGKHIQVAEILLEHGANVDIRGPREQTPLHEAIANVGIVQSLLNKGTNVNCRQDDLRTPLHLAAYHGELKVAQVLVEQKADVDSQDNEGKTPLHLLLEAWPEDTGRDDNNSNLDLARLLLEHGTNANIRTKNGWTPLHAAAFQGRFEVSRVLLDYGANPNVENQQGLTPLHLVSAGKYDSQEHGVGIAQLLVEHGVDVNARNKNKSTPLHLASFKGRLQIVQVLLISFIFIFIPFLFFDYRCFSTMARMQTRRMAVVRLRYMQYHKVSTTPKNKVSVLHCYYWSVVWMRTHGIKKVGPRYIEQLSKGSSRSHKFFSIMVQTRTWRPMRAKRCCTSCHEANMTPKNKVSVLHGYYWSAM